MIFAGCNYYYGSDYCFVVETDTKQQTCSIQTNNGESEVGWCELYAIPLNDNSLSSLGVFAGTLRSLFDNRYYNLGLGANGTFRIKYVHELQLLHSIAGCHVPTIEFLGMWFDKAGNMVRPFDDYFYDGGYSKVKDIVTKNYHEFPPNSDIVIMYFAQLMQDENCNSAKQLFLRSRPF